MLLCIVRRQPLGYSAPFSEVLALMSHSLESRLLVSFFYLWAESSNGELFTEDAF